MAKNKYKKKIEEQETEEQETDDVETAYCYKCKEHTMVLAENGLVFVCQKCDGWCYSSS